ncbi:hypothetical protein ACWCRF_09225 [Streptomyces sp. NPDC002405]
MTTPSRLPDPYGAQQRCQPRRHSPTPLRRRRPDLSRESLRASDERFAQAAGILHL